MTFILSKHPVCWKAFSTTKNTPLCFPFFSSKVSYHVANSSLKFVYSFDSFFAVHCFFIVFSWFFEKHEKTGKKANFENHEKTMKRLWKNHQKTIKKPIFARRVQTFNYCLSVVLHIQHLLYLTLELPFSYYELSRKGLIMHFY